MKGHFYQSKSTNIYIPGPLVCYMTLCGSDYRFTLIWKKIKGDVLELQSLLYHYIAFLRMKWMMLCIEEADCLVLTLGSPVYKLGVLLASYLNFLGHGGPHL